MSNLYRNLLLGVKERMDEHINLCPRLQKAIWKLAELQPLLLVPLGHGADHCQPRAQARKGVLTFRTELWTQCSLKHCLESSSGLSS